MILCKHSSFFKCAPKKLTIFLLLILFTAADEEKVECVVMGGIYSFFAIQTIEKYSKKILIFFQFSEKCLCIYSIEPPTFSSKHFVSLVFRWDSQENLQNSSSDKHSRSAYSSYLFRSLNLHNSWGKKTTYPRRSWCIRDTHPGFFWCKHNFSFRFIVYL